MRIFLIIFVFIIAAIVSIFGFRGSLSEKTPIEVFPDMDRQAKYKPQGGKTSSAAGPNNRRVPVNTWGRGNYLSYEEVFSEDFEDTKLGSTAYLYGKEADGSWVEKLPVEADFSLIELGREKYEIFCLACHGAAGDGNGVTKPYGILATSYHDDRLRNEADGYIYDVIANGKGLMYGLKDRLTPKERWAVVLYVRALQRSQNASAEDVPAGERAELGI